MGCAKKFNLLRKRNHCRYCGKIVCSECCTNTLPHYDPIKRKRGVIVKVCDLCWDKYKVKPLMDVKQMHNLSKKLKNGSQSEQSIEDSKSKMSDSSDWDTMYDNMQINIPQSQTDTVLLYDDMLSNPLPLEQEVKNEYVQDMDTVNAIISNNDSLMQSADMSKFNVLDAVVLDENKVHVNLDSDDSDDFAAHFANIVIPDSHQTPIPNERIKSSDFYAFMDNVPDDNNKKKDVVAAVVDVNDKVQENEFWDANNANVKQLGFLGYGSEQIEAAWFMMKANVEHNNIVPDHGPLFVETMLDYLNKVQKKKSKAIIMNAYK